MKDIPAFPIQGFSTRNGQGFQLVMADGMTLRDYIAAKAMQAMLSKNGFYDNEDQFSEWCYETADAMLKARGE